MPTKEIDLSVLEEAIEKIELELESPLPTPPVGTNIVWYRRGKAEEGGELAAIVTKVQGPGKVVPTIFQPLSMPLFQIQNCLYINHKQHADRNNAASRQNGAWAYPEGYDVPDFHYDLHRKKLQEKLRSSKAQLAEAKAIQEKQDAPTKKVTKKPVAKATS